MRQHMQFGGLVRPDMHEAAAARRKQIGRRSMQKLRRVGRGRRALKYLRLCGRVRGAEARRMRGVWPKVKRHDRCG